MNRKIVNESQTPAKTARPQVDYDKKSYTPPKTSRPTPDSSQSNNSNNR